MNRVLVVFSDGLLSELDSARGLVSRSAWIRQAVEDKLMKEAVAPLVPDMATAGICPPCPPWEAEPKPKPRRKKSVKVPDQPVSVMNRGGATVPTQEPSPASVPLAIRSAIREFPSRCNRGACTGTIKPNGRCIRCNQEPLKESK